MHDPASASALVDGVCTITIRVAYADCDPMNCAYHARYLHWCDMARTEYLRATGFSYAECERHGLFLAVADARLRYFAPAFFDEVVQLRCWVRRAGSRLVEFGYAVERDGARLATATTTLVPHAGGFRATRMPAEIQRALRERADPVPVA